MLTFYGSKARQAIKIPFDTLTFPENVDWIDAFRPSAEEVVFLERCLKVRMPTREDLTEIESCSRMSVIGDAVFLSMPASVEDAEGYPAATPIGFVVTKDLVATLRFERLPSFKNLA